MIKEFLLHILALFVVLTSTFADYDCLCNYNTETNVFPDASNQSQPIGVMNEFDCKPLGKDSGMAGWLTVQFEHQLAYVANNSNIQLQVCPGAPGKQDLLTSHGPSASMALSTAMPSSAATQQMSSSVAMETTTMMNTAGTPPPGTQYGCPQKHFDFAAAETGVLFTVKHTCFELIPTNHSWAYAEADCKRRGGHLATIDGEEKQTLIYEIVRSFDGPAVWIGLHDRDHEEQFQWVSGEPVNYTNWYPNRKSLVLHNIEDCVVLVPAYNHNGTWEDDVCTKTHGYICEFDAVSGSQIGSTQAPNTGDSDGDTHMCPLHLLVLAQQYGTDVAQHGNSCYELLHSKVSYPHAEHLCNEAGGHLAHINNAEEQAYIQDFMMRHNPTKAVWIGLNDHNTEGTFEWTNGDSVTYTNWIDGHEDNFASHNQEDCVALVPYKNGTWDDIPCGYSSILGGGDLGETHMGFCEYSTVPKIPGAIIVG